MIIIYVIKVKLNPTKEQEYLLFQSANISRYAYNWALDKQIEYYKQYNKLMNFLDLRKLFTEHKQQNQWLYNVSGDIPKQAIKDLNTAYTNFFRIQKESKVKYTKSKLKYYKIHNKPLTFYDLKGYPKFKSKKKTKLSFYQDNVKLLIKEDKILIEKVGWVELSEHNRLPLRLNRQGIKINNPHISFDNKYWYISISIEEDSQKTIELSNNIIGIDVGIKTLATCSDGMKFKNINKTERIKKLEKKLKRLQRKVSCKYQINKIEDKFNKTKNIIKEDKKIKLIYRKLHNIRLDYTHKVTTTIVKAKPCRIVIEDLNISGMLKNKHLSKSIQDLMLNEFFRQLQYKSINNGIELIRADRFYSSSKLCSCCGNIKKDLKLSDRTYICETCGQVIDRDENASINLKHYKLV